MEKTTFDLTSHADRDALGKLIAEAVERAQGRRDMSELYYATRWESIQSMDSTDLAENIVLALATHPAIRDRQAKRT